MKVRFQWLFLFLLLSFAVRGNNVKVGGSPALELGSDNSTVSINCTLSWENSWRDEFNWDAVWVFVKYKKEGDTGAWGHLNLGTTPVVPSGFTFDLGKKGAKNVGLFIFRDSKSGGPVNGVNVTLKTTLSELSGVSVDDIRSGKVYAAVSALEMVYVPYGAYYLGDGASNNTFCDAQGKPVILDNEAARSIYTKTNGSVSSVSVNANYPKGYKGFYCMKYELSQEQYVSFLNMLSYDQQKARIGNTLDNLQKGNYVFGDKSRPSARNGIVVFAKQSGKPALFANNLNSAEPYYAKDDGQTVACNYLTPEDMLAYCDWCGLRPMSEMEYEKACRRPYPQPSVSKEYAWNQTSYTAISGAGDLTGLNTEDETPSSPAKNVNVNNAAFGPARCGSFGSASSTQSQSGATFWGVMEMSGNVGELCYNVKATGFNTSDVMVSHGDGSINANGTTNTNTSYWPVGTTAGNFSVRGGSFASADTNLRVSDRTVLSVSNVRDSSIGFRAVRTFGGGSVTLTGGSIVAENNLATDTICPGVSFTVKSQQDAQLTGISDIPVSYIWYLDNVVIPDQSGSELNYAFDNTTNALKTFTLTRKAVCAVGEVMTSAAVTIRVPNPEFNLSTNLVEINGCQISTTTTATAIMSGANANYSWIYSGKTISTGNKYVPLYTHFDKNQGKLDIICEAHIMGCTTLKNLSVNIATVQILEKNTLTLEECGNFLFTDDRDGNAYCTLKIGERCWMGSDLRYGSGLYNWATAMANAASSGNNPSGVRGICPKGWHLPSVPEWNMVISDAQMLTSLQLGTRGYWWSTTYGNNNTWSCTLSGNSAIIGQYAVTNTFTVRCTQDL